MTKQSTAQVSDTANDHSEVKALWDVVGILVNQLVLAKYLDAKVLCGHLSSLARAAPPAPPLQRLIDNLDYGIRIQEANKSPGFYLGNRR